MKSRITLGLIALSLCATSFASPNTSDIQIGSGMMTGKATLTFTLADLVPNVSYTVHCSIHSNADADVNVYSNGGMMALDGARMDSNVIKLKKDHKDKGYELTLQAANYMQTLTFINLDDTARVDLDSCVAKVN